MLTPLSHYQWALPPELIAQTAVYPRSHSRLLVYNVPQREVLAETYFHDVCRFLDGFSTCVVNDSPVAPCRVVGKKMSGGKVEGLFLPPWGKLIPGKSVITGKVLSSRPLRPGQQLIFGSNEVSILSVQVHCSLGDGNYELLYMGNEIISLFDFLQRVGTYPTPPYLKGSYSEHDYQCLYADKMQDLASGSVAAPTAGLHFDAPLLEKMSQQITFLSLKLHVGEGTFAPIRSDHVEHHSMHEELFEISPSSVNKINQKMRGEDRSKWLCVGTTSFRTLETLFERGEVLPPEGIKAKTKLYLTPTENQFRPKSCQALITNFHMPESTLSVLISALIGIESFRKLYQYAIQQHYRFGSLGDACLFLFETGED